MATTVRVVFPHVMPGKKAVILHRMIASGNETILKEVAEDTISAHECVIWEGQELVLRELDAE